jgi:hypothetical protein
MLKNEIEKVIQSKDRKIKDEIKKNYLTLLLNSI